MNSPCIAITDATGWARRTELDILLQRQGSTNSQYKFALFSSNILKLSSLVVTATRLAIPFHSEIYLNMPRTILFNLFCALLLCPMIEFSTLFFLILW